MPAAAAAVLLVAIVAEDPAPLRNAPRDDAPVQATLWRGDWLEVRGETAGFLKVYDHRHERPGYLRPAVARVHRLDEETAPELRAVVRFLRDASGFESLGIGYAALYLRAAPAGAESSEVFAAIGTMAARLARRASARRAATATAPVSAAAAQLEVAETYGVHFKAMEGALAGAGTRVCYDGEAWERVLASPGAAPIERARAALFLDGQAASDGCTDPTLPAAARRALNDHAQKALEAVDPGALSPALAGRVRLARARALAWRAFDEVRRPAGIDMGLGTGAEAAARAATAAVRELALTDKGVLAPEDVALRDEIAVRVAASRWAAEAPAVASGKSRDRADAARATIAVVPGKAGETCLRVLERTSERNSGDASAPRIAGERCTYGVIWQSALRWSASGAAATIAVQPLPAWTELWVLRRSQPIAPAAPSWTIEPLTPATTEPEVGYVEAAGFSPDGAHLLIVREARVLAGAGAAAGLQRWFQVLSLSTLAVEKQAHSADKLLAFKRWSTPSWHTGTLALR